LLRYIVEAQPAIASARAAANSRELVRRIKRTARLSRIGLIAG
jgi:hypothetical protein